MSQTIFIIEDNVQMAKITAKLLQREGYQVEYSTSAEEGLQRALRGGIDLIILDILMPRLNGYQVIEQLKKSEAARHIPVLLATAKGRHDIIYDTSCYFLYGVYGLLRKPYRPVDLISQVREILRLGAVKKPSIEKNKLC